VPYEFTQYEPEPEPLASSAHSGVPPRKLTGIGLLDPPVPPRKPIGPIPRIPASLLLRIVAALLLAGIGVTFFLMFLGRH